MQTATVRREMQALEPCSPSVLLIISLISMYLERKGHCSQN